MAATLNTRRRPCYRCVTVAILPAILPSCRSPRAITTERLVLRPVRITDAARAVDILSAWGVSRNLSRAAFPPDPCEIERWFADHAREWEMGAAYRFAITCNGTMIGVVDIDGVARAEARLGYWLDRAAWGRGSASEAGAALVRFAFSVARLTVPRAGHGGDNPASGRVLTKLGFTRSSAAPVFSRPRGETIMQGRYVLRHGSAVTAAHDLDGQDQARPLSFGRLLMSAPLTDEDLPPRAYKARDVES